MSHGVFFKADLGPSGIETLLNGVDAAAAPAEQPQDVSVAAAGANPLQPPTIEDFLDEEGTLPSHRQRRVLRMDAKRQCDATRRDATRRDATRHRTAQHGTARHGTARRDVTRFDSIDGQAHLAYGECDWCGGRPARQTCHCASPDARARSDPFARRREILCV
jgi:hypothetical protein